MRWLLQQDYRRLWVEGKRQDNSQPFKGFRESGRVVGPPPQAGFADENEFGLL